MNKSMFNASDSSPKSGKKSERMATQNPADLPNPYQQARRKRIASRKKRRFDAVFARLPKPPNINVQVQAITLPAVLQPTPWSFSKILSCLLLIGAAYTFATLHNQDDWFVYREDVRFHNLIRMNGDNLYSLLDVDGLNVFWVDPETVRQALLTQPWIENAQVDVAMPAGIAVNVTEMTPAAVWVTNNGSYWLAMNGAALPIETIEGSALPEVALPQIIDSLQEARTIGDGPLTIDPQVLKSALTLIAAVPELEGVVRYNKSIGLNFPLPELSVWVYWGDGSSLETKLENLTVAREVIRKGEKPAQIVDIRLIDRPYVR